MHGLDIASLTKTALETMRDQGYASSSVAEVEQDFSRIVCLHTYYGRDIIDSKIIDEYATAQTTLFRCGAFDKNRLRKKMCTIERLKLFALSGNWPVVTRKRKARFPISPYYEELVDIIREQAFGSEVTRNNHMRCAQRHFSWLIREGHSDLAYVDAGVIKRYMVDCTAELSNRSIGTMKSSLKRSYGYLHEKGYCPYSFEGILSFPVAIKHKIAPAIPPEEAAETLRAVNRTTNKGKRDYAIILLGAVVGLRGGDIAKLQLESFDWANGEIRIIQSKTGKALALPLTTDVGEAVKDYILNGRPKSDNRSVFLSMQPPYRAIGSSMANCVHVAYRQGLRLPPSGFHSLRRAVGTNMISAGISVETVAQVLGHSAINSTTPYISLDSKHLKICALELDGIEPDGGDWI